MVRDATAYYLEHPETLEGSKDWFGKLPPKVQKQALGFTTDSVTAKASHTVLQRIQDAWGEIRDAGNSE